MFLLNTSRHLEWDSGFFHLKIGRIDYFLEDERFLENEVNRYREGRYDLLYVFTNHGQKSNSLPTEPIDTKRTYTIDIPSEVEVKHNVSSFSGNPEELYDLAYQSGFDSRYRLDLHFKAGEFERLYKEWIQNSVNHLIADEVLVYRDGGKTVGFVTLSIKDVEGSIGLLAVDNNYRGGGIATSLIRSCMNFCYRSGIKKLSVATQKSNAVACAFYEKNMMTVQSDVDIFHLWLK